MSYFNLQVKKLSYCNLQIRKLWAIATYRWENCQFCTCKWENCELCNSQVRKLWAIPTGMWENYELLQLSGEKTELLQHTDEKTVSYCNLKGEKTLILSSLSQVWTHCSEGPLVRRPNRVSPAAHRMMCPLLKILHWFAILNLGFTSASKLIFWNFYFCGQGKNWYFQLACIVFKWWIE